MHESNLIEHQTIIETMATNDQNIKLWSSKQAQQAQDKSMCNKHNTMQWKHLKQNTNTIA